jgi:predicted protein tyrosine phosphatase
MALIAVCSLALLEREITRLRPWGVVSLLSPGSMIATPERIAADKHLALEVHDIIEAIDGHTHPIQDHAATLLDFVNQWDARQPLLIHCWAGVSRSTASAFIAACTVNPYASEREIAEEIRAASPTATPNRLLVAHADDILQREDCWEGVPFALPAVWPTLGGLSQ